MAEPASSRLGELYRRLDECSRRTEEELGKQPVNDTRVAQLQKQADILLAQIDRQTSGEVQHHGSVLCCQAPLASGSTSVISMHIHANVSRASWKP